MKSKAWQTGANAMARALWKSGKRYEAYMLMREVIKNSQSEQFEFEEAA
jgi:hypothetical protein